MTLPKEGPLRLQAEGYWAVEVWLGGVNATRPRYLCHAENDRQAQRIAGHVMGSSSDVHGFSYYRLELPIRNHPAGGLPALGEWRSVTAEEWPDMMLANAASEAMLQDHLSRASAPAASHAA